MHSAAYVQSCVLIVDKDLPFIATSADGLMSMKILKTDVVVSVAVELKTQVGASTDESKMREKMRVKMRKTKKSFFFKPHRALERNPLLPSSYELVSHA